MRRLYLGTAPSGEILDLIGTDRDGLVAHINNYLIEGMTKENFGKTWGLDHIVPVELFGIEELKLCYNYNNIMPMFNHDNRLKGASVHFSLAKLESMHTNVYIQTLIDRCQTEINNRYQKYLL